MAVAGRAVDDPRRPPDKGGWSALWSIGLALRRLMLRTGQGPLRPIWHAAYETFLHPVAFLLRRDLDVSVYVKGTIGTGDPVYGLSDVDLVVVAPADEGRSRSRIGRRWAELCRRVPPLAWMVSELYAYEDVELHDVASTTCFTYGLDQPEPYPAAFHGPGHEDSAGLLKWPGLWPTREWRLLAGPERRPTGVRDDPDHRRLASWLMLQFWWRYALDAVLRPGDPHVAYLCVKLVAEPARMLLWLPQGERVLHRRDALRRAAELLPEERASFERALELLDTLHLSPPAPLEEFLPILLRLSTRVADAIAAGAKGAGATDVRLLGADDEPIVRGGADGARLPLTDWRTLVRPLPGDEAFVPSPGDPSAVETLAAAARAYVIGVYPALRAGELLVLASPKGGRREHRTLLSPLSDPVSFALLDGRDSASFPSVPGWSALDWARRAVAEHRAWLEHDLSLPAGDTLAMLLSAARSALFLADIEDGLPALSLTLATTARRLAEREPSTRTAAEEAIASYREAVLDERPLPAAVLAALRAAVSRLPAYAPRR